MKWNVLSRMRVVWVAALLLALGGGCQSETATEETVEAVSPEEVEVVVEEVAPAARDVAAPAGEPAAGADQEGDEDDLVLFAEGLPEEDGPAPLEVRFTVESLIGGEMDGPKYTWEFGDGSPPSHEASPIHTYEKPGEYTVTVRIVDATGQRGWDEIEIEVYAPED